MKIYRLPAMSIFLILTSCSSCPKDNQHLEPRLKMTDQQREACLTDSLDCIFPINRTDAESIARSKEFEEGLEPWIYNLDYNYPYGRHIWNLRNTLYDRSASGIDQGGNILDIDAETGKQLCAGASWSRIS